MWEYYGDKSILVTGGSGFLGTAIVHRLLSRTSASPIYLLCRCSADELHAKWMRSLSPEISKELSGSRRIVILNGDILKPNMGLSSPELEMIQHNVQIVIHAASSINLVKSLCDLAPIIIQATETIAQFSLTIQHLHRFVYVSTAYANTHLYARNEQMDLEIREEIYAPKRTTTAYEEWMEVQNQGTSQAYEAGNFPWAYAYAKNLTERLLLHWFDDQNSQEKLLLIRPAVIGPAQEVPFPGYCLPMSTPSTLLAAALTLCPSWKVRGASLIENPEDHVRIDEVPVDVVVDRLLCHLAVGTVGCVHAVSGKNARMGIAEWWGPLMQFRQFPWTLRREWTLDDWDSPNQHPICRLFRILGTSFCFSEDRTVVMREKLSNEDYSSLQLFTRVHLGKQLLDRAGHIRFVMDRIARKSVWASLIIRIFYHNFGKNGSRKPRTL